MASNDWQQRTSLLIGQETVELLAQKHVLICGLGGVGAMAAEQLCRAGIGRLTIVDGDVVNESNRNRQLPALVSTQNLPKTEVMRQRLLDINPNLILRIINQYIKDQAVLDVLLEAGYDFVVDAIDTLSPKVFLLFHAHRLGLKIVSSMGAGGKCNPEMVQISDISKSHNCKLAFYIRKRLHKLDVWSGITVIFSPEMVSSQAIELLDGEMNKKSTVGTISYMPAIFGCFCASVVLRSFLPQNNRE